MGRPKGYMKRRKSWFQKAHNLTPNKVKTLVSSENLCKNEESVRYVRLSVDEQQMVDDNPIPPAAEPAGAASDKSGVEFKFLRPRQSKPSGTRRQLSKTQIQRAESDSYRLLHCGEMWKMMNEVFREHRHQHPKCHGDLCFDFQNEMQWGFCWRESVLCNRCSYKSKLYNIFREIETKGRGRRAATANVGLNIAMTQTPVGPSSVRKLLLGSNIPPPSVAGMQKVSKKVNTFIETENNADMKRRRLKLSEINEMRGQARHEISIQSDGLYNNSLWSGVTRTPYQPATQMAYVVAENVTGKHQIINVELVNKICSKHGYHTMEDEECDISTGDCTATTSMETSIGDEKRWARLVLEGLLEDGLSVKYITTDQDTAAYLAATELYEENKTQTRPEHQVDTRHLSCSHRKQIKNSTDVQAMMPGKTLQYKQYLQGRFATDISKRCQKEYSTIFKEEAGNFSVIEDRINLAIGAIKRCYSGDHTRCKRFSSVCNGEETDNWIFRSAYLPKNFKINLNNEENDEVLLRCIEYRLGREILQKTRLNTNSQKVEATNRSIRRSLPKNVNFGRAFPGRAHSAIHSVNNGPGESLQQLCIRAGCPIPSGGKVSQALINEQRLSEKQKERARSIVNKCKRITRTTHLFKMYEKDREKNKYIRASIAKELKVQNHRKELPQPVPCTSASDHSYNRRAAVRTQRKSKKIQGGS